ncbi:MAG: hypothetical protein JO112_11370 [Planctomycetes bacterium]|nr:hypothetical protein [Planctomycetota bacterium]
MPEDLLQELDTTGPVAESLENIEDLLRLFRRNVRLAVEGMKGSAAVFGNIWQRMVLDVAKGQTAEIQSTRAPLFSAFEKRLSLLKQTHTLAGWLAQLERPAVPDPDVLLPEIEAMERLKSRVFGRWETVEDLEDLAARDYPLTTEELERIGPQRRPPASWYTEETKPF